MRPWRSPQYTVPSATEAVSHGQGSSSSVANAWDQSTRARSRSTDAIRRSPVVTTRESERTVIETFVASGGIATTAAIVAVTGSTTTSCPVMLP